MVLTKNKNLFKNIIIIGTLLIILIIIIILIKPKSTTSNYDENNEPAEIKKLDKEQHMSFQIPPIDI